MIKPGLEKEWEECKAKNKDGYGGAIMQVAEKVLEYLDDRRIMIIVGPRYNMGRMRRFVNKALVRLMEIRTGGQAMTCHDLISKADDEIAAGGITGFMSGCVAQLVSQFHVRGDEFRRAWNREWGVEENESKGGTVNPAIITITPKQG